VSHIAWAVLLICLFVGVTLFFSVNNIALRILSRFKLQEAFKSANKNEGSEVIVDYIVENSEMWILTCSLYRLIFNVGILLLLVSILTSLRANSLMITDYIIVFVITTALFSVFSLAIPHAWAKYAGEKVLSRTYRVLMFFAIIASPILYTMKLYDGFVRRLAGVTEISPDQQQEEKQEEFLTDLQEHRMEGAVDEEEQEMIEKVLRLSDRTADQIMTPRTDIVAVEINSDLQTVLQTITKAGHTRVPVYEDNIDNIVGLIYAKDLLTEIGKNPTNFNLREKIRKAYFVPETKPLRILLHEFQNQKLHIAVVLDEYGGTAGIVTLEDILEELVGEIADEYEEIPTEPIKKIDQNTIEVDARTYVNDLNDEFELNLPEDEDYDTVGGFAFSRLGYIPKTGETFEHKNMKFTIASAEARRIKRIRIQRNVNRDL
jgi:putative hemolysin